MILSELLKKAEITTPFEADFEITGIACDSRKVEKGNLFIAVNGNKESGLSYIPEAISNGAVAILTDTPVEAQIPVFEVKNARQAMAKLASLFYQNYPENLLAVTGTNGKTSTVFFVREILEALGKNAASIGTLGVQSKNHHSYAGMTTTDSITLSKDLQTLSENSVNYVALEASSHGLDQDRLSGLKFKAAAFTNLTRDHLDYHQNMENYLMAKMRLFTELTTQTAVLNADIPEFTTIQKICQQKGLNVISYGKQGQQIRLINQKLYETGQDLTLEVFGERYDVHLPVAGNFQGYNVLAAIGLVLSLNFAIPDVIMALSHLKSPAGRMELIAQTKTGATIFVDYAHTPDGLETALTSLKRQTKGKLYVVFGCGGNRDRGKRPIMGQIAAQLADYVIVTDDNPRFEDAAEIRSEIMQGCPNAHPIADRAKAIYHAIRKLQKADCLLIAGKGHEEGQMINGFNHPFNDRIQALLALKSQEEKPLWTSDELKKATGGKAYKAFIGYGVSIDSRTIIPGDIYVALKGEKFDGHDFVADALQKGAAAAIVSRDVPQVDQTDKLFFVTNTDEALEDMAKYAVQNSKTIKIGITGSSGKTTSKEMLATALKGQGEVHFTQGNLNNQWGVPLTLARMPRLANWTIIEMGMNHIGEMEYLSYLVKPDIVLITMICSAHLEFFKDVQQIADAKSEIFKFMNKNGAVFLNADNDQFQHLKQRASENDISHIYSFGSKPEASVKLLNYAINKEGSIAQIQINGQIKQLQLQLAGLHFIQNALGVLGVVLALGADVDKAIENLKHIKPLKGRGATLQKEIDGKTITFIDDAYNANPASMAASLDVLSRYPGRKIAVLGEMKELGTESRQLHIGLKDIIEKNNIDLVFTIGEEIKQLFDVLPESKKAVAVLNAPEVIESLKAVLQDGDTVLIKGSNSMRLDKILEAFQ
ncbi:MAG: UDP-N-acetylmuramoyl-L-alanyl-D-glutamate--2,6-diaminopimelate ligase [Alphaproteobacteria bacterium]|nr:UDP-N-acetylmuramoyl-L-alanyl-D-glutamate--2,6-diaminopimelate ligase [Alphaproteobacteria bacterium]